MTVLKPYGRVSDPPCFPWEIHRKSPRVANDYGDSKWLRRSHFSMAGSFENICWYSSGHGDTAKITWRHPQTPPKMATRRISRTFIPKAPNHKTTSPTPLQMMFPGLFSKFCFHSCLAAIAEKITPENCQKKGHFPTLPNGRVQLTQQFPWV